MVLESIRDRLSGSISVGESSISRSTIAGIVAAWFFSAILAGVEFFIGLFFSTTEALNSSIEAVGGAILAGTSPIGSVPLTLVDVLAGSITSVASAGGPFAPALVVLAWGLVVIGLLVLIERSIGLLIRVIPVL